jgi:pimeloyl-ACP methyl ester carboxylesterase
VDRGRALHRLIPNAIFRVIPDAGHLVIEERPRQLLNEMLPFLRGVAHR